MLASHKTAGTVHPRACGERAAQANAVTKEGGSSPRLRGTLRLMARLNRTRRFIPAPAGNAM